MAEGYRAVKLALIRIRHNPDITDDELYLILHRLYKTAANGRRKKARRRGKQADRQFIHRLGG